MYDDISAEVCGIRVAKVDLDAVVGMLLLLHTDLSTTGSVDIPDHTSASQTLNPGTHWGPKLPKLDCNRCLIIGKQRA